MMQTTKDRIRLFLEYKGISQNAFERACGFSHGYVCNIRRAPSEDACSLIVRQYPELNAIWLKTGEGEMLNETASRLPILENERSRYMEMIRVRNKRISDLEKLVVILQAEIDNLKNNV